jgi:hypothetical protein
MPEGFCPGAWRDIRECVSVLYMGGTSYPWLGENEMIKCCTDGLRPVVSRLERLEPLEYDPHLPQLRKRMIILRPCTIFLDKVIYLI